MILISFKALRQRLGMKSERKIRYDKKKLKTSDKQQRSKISVYTNLKNIKILGQRKAIWEFQMSNYMRKEAFTEESFTVL